MSRIDSVEIVGFRPHKLLAMNNVLSGWQEKGGAKRIKIGYDKNTDKLMGKNRKIVQGFLKELFSVHSIGRERKHYVQN